MPIDDEPSDSGQVYDQSYRPFVMFDREILTGEAYADLSPADIMTYLALKSYGNDGGGNIFPSIASLAKRAHCSPRTCHDCLNALEAVGLIRRVAQFRASPEGGARRTTNAYYLLPIAPKVESTALQISQGRSANFAEGGLQISQSNEVDTYEVDTPKYLPPTPLRGESASPTETPVASRSRKSRRDIAREVYEEIPFQEFWKAYPKKDGKIEAALAWKRLQPGPDLFEKIITAVERAKAGVWKGKDIQYIPNAATYLNNDRWDDEQASSKQIAKKAESESDNLTFLKNLNYAWIGELEVEQTGMAYRGKTPRQKFSARIYAEVRDGDGTVGDYCWTVYADENGENEERSKYYGRRIHWNVLPSKDYKQFLPSEGWR